MGMFFVNYSSSINLKEQFTQKWKFSENVLTPQTNQDVDELVSSSKQIWSYLALHHCLTTMDPLQWMGAVRIRVQTADKNITIIHK